jgi:hypothetical protein
MANWDRNFYTAEVGGRTLVDEMERRGILRSGDTIGYALGLSHGSYRGLPTVGHGGSDAGYRSSFLRFPDQATSMAVLCNFPTSNPGSLVNQVADIVLENELHPRVEDDAPEDDRDAPDPVPLSGEEVARLEGYYVRDDYDTPMPIRDRNGLLFAGSQRLFHLGDWEFRFGGSDDTTRFWEASDGAILTVGPDGRQYRRYPRIDPDSVDLDEYVGAYWSDDLGVEYQVRREEDQLVYWHRKFGTRTLSPLFPDGFSANGGVIFTRDTQGRINGFTVSSGRVWKVRFRRLDGPYPR